MRSEVSIRTGTVEDADRLAPFAAMTFEDSFGNQNRPEDMAAYLEANFSMKIFAEQLTDPRSIFRIADRDDQTVGYTMLRQSPPPEVLDESSSVELVRIYVDKLFVGTGLGAMLMLDCLEQARKAGVGSIWLGVWERNARAIQFYERWGFSIIGEHEFVLGEDIQNDYLMARSLEDKAS